MKVFETQFHKGSYIDRIRGEVGIPVAAPFSGSEKGLAIKGNGSSSQVEYLTDAISLVNGYSVSTWVRSTGTAVGQIVSVDDQNASERVFQLRFDQRSPLPSYLVYYPVLLAVISAIIFSILHIFESTSGFVFYYFSFSLCFILSYLVDQFWNIITRIVSSAAK